MAKFAAYLKYISKSNVGYLYTSIICTFIFCKMNNIYFVKTYTINIKSNEVNYCEVFCKVRTFFSQN